MFTAVMYAFIAPVTDQRASRKPTTVIVTVAPVWWSSRCRLPPSSWEAWCGMTLSKWAIRLVIVAGPATRVNRPTASSSTEGIAKKVEYASAEAIIGMLSSSDSLPARLKIATQSRRERSVRPGSGCEASSGAGRRRRESRTGRSSRVPSSACRAIVIPFLGSGPERAPGSGGYALRFGPRARLRRGRRGRRLRRGLRGRRLSRQDGPDLRRRLLRDDAEDRAGGCVEEPPAALQPRLPPGIGRDRREQRLQVVRHLPQLAGRCVPSLHTRPDIRRRGSLHRHRTSTASPSASRVSVSPRVQRLRDYDAGDRRRGDDGERVRTARPPGSRRRPRRLGYGDRGRGLVL